MTLAEAVEHACDQPTLVEALVEIVSWTNREHPGPLKESFSVLLKRWNELERDE